MAVKSMVREISRVVRSGDIFKENSQAQTALGYALNFLLGLLLSMARVFGSCGPFGIAFVARSGAGLGGVFSVLGAAVGYLLIGGLDWGIRYVAAAVLVFAAAFVFQGTRSGQKSWFMPLIATLVMLVTGFLNSFEIDSSLYAIIRLIVEVTLTAGATYFFSSALNETPRLTETEELRHGVSLLVLFACVLMALAPLEFLDVLSVGRIVAVLFVMTASYRGGMLSGCAAGTGLGLAMDIAYGGAPFFTMAYAFSGLISGVFSKHGRVIFVLTYIMANAVSIIWTYDSGIRIEPLYEAFAASVIFLVLPTSLLNRVGALLQPAAVGHGELALRSYQSRRVSKIGEAFLDLYETVEKNLDRECNDNDIAKVFDRAADSICVSCKRKNECWNANYVDTVSIMNDATKAMLKRGKLKREDLPERFTEGCEQLSKYVSAVNLELRRMMYRRQFRSRMSENKIAACGQYADIAEILDSVSEEMGYANGNDPLAERRLLRYLQSLDIDCDVSVFRDKNGRLRAVIDSGWLAPLLRDPKYLDKLSAVLGTRLCRPIAETDISEGRITLLEAEPLSVSVGIAAMKKKGEPVSGDKGTYFKTDQGVLCVLLSDGMGSGDEAAKESEAATRILEKFLRSGVEPSTAMKILNSVMLLKNGENWGYATVDLMCIDLFTGDTSFYKYGAAPSYVRSGKVIRRVRCATMAAGMTVGEGSKPDVMRMKLRPGSLAVIASDGVMMDDDDLWLRTMLEAYQGSDTKALAKDALQMAVKQYGCEDDMTVLAVYVDERG